jgi:hypothetical protein
MEDEVNKCECGRNIMEGFEISIGLKMGQLSTNMKSGVCSNCASLIKKTIIENGMDIRKLFGLQGN